MSAAKTPPRAAGPFTAKKHEVTSSVPALFQYESCGSDDLPDGSSILLAAAAQ